MSDIPSVSPPAKRRYGGVSGEERSKQRQERLLASALDVFGEMGLARATMRDICADARLAERYFYEHFSSTTEAFEAVYQQLSAELAEQVAKAVSRAPPSLSGRAGAGLKVFFQFIKDDPRRAQIVLLDGATLGHHDLHNAKASIRDFAMVLNHVAKDMYPDLPAGVNRELVVSGLIGMAVQTCIAWTRGGFQDSIESVIEHNLYAWYGLDQWYARIKSDGPPRAVQTDSPKRDALAEQC